MEVRKARLGKGESWLAIWLQISLWANPTSGSCGSHWEFHEMRQRAESLLLLLSHSGLGLAIGKCYYMGKAVLSEGHSCEPQLLIFSVAGE